MIHGDLHKRSSLQNCYPAVRNWFLRLSMLALFFVFAFSLTAFAQNHPPKQSFVDSEEKVMAFFVFFAVAIAVRLGSAEGAVAIFYLGSLFFCGWYALAQPLKAIPTLIVFLLPATWWHRAKLGWKGLIGIWAFLLTYSWFVIKEVVVAVMIFPTFHLLAYRTSRFIDQRYPGSGRGEGENGVVAKTSSEGILGEGIFSEMVDRLVQSFRGILAHSMGEEAPDAVPVQNATVLQMQFQDSHQMSRALTDLVRRDKNFKEKEFLKRVEDVFWKVQKTLYSQDIEKIQPFISDGLFEQLAVRVEEQRAAGVRYQTSDMGIYDLRFVQVQSEKNFDIAHILVRAFAQESLVATENGDAVSTEGGRRQFDEVWAFLRRPGAQTLQRPGLWEGFCPNCSAPIEIGQAACCKVCNSFLRAGTHDWVLFQMNPACEWEYGETEEIPGLRDLKIVDPCFAVQHIEDRSAVTFWKERQAERLGNVEPLRRFALAESCDRLEKKWQETTAGQEFQNFCALGKVRLKAALCNPDWDRLYVETLWSGVPMISKSGKSRAVSTKPRFFRKIQILTRRHGLVTSLDSSLSSSHCPSCGAASKSGFTSRCEYCQTVLNEGNASWVLEGWAAEEDSELLKALSQPVDKKIAVPRVFAEGGSRLDTVAALAQMMLADGVVDEVEMKMLQGFASSHGISTAKVEQVIQSLREGWIHVPKVEKRQDAYSLLQSAVRMALADGTLADSEIDTLHHLARHLGYSEADVKYLLARHHKQEFQDKKRR